MFKTTLLLFSFLLFTGCAERGYILKSNIKTQTITAESVTSIDTQSTHSKLRKEEDNTLLTKMTTVVKKALKKQKKSEPTYSSKKVKTIKKKVLKKQTTTTVKKENTYIADTVEAETNIPSEKIKKSNDNEENALKEEARRSKELREAKLKEIKKLKELAKQKTHTPLIQPSKKINTNETITTNTTEEKQKKLREEKEALAAKASLAEQRRLKEKMLQAKREKERQRDLSVPKEKAPLATTKALNFHPINKVYHKFGSSEVHGHVIYLTPNGQETRLTQTKVYLLPISAKLNNWYNNYYLKNKNSTNKTIVNYLNQTSLNLERNFEFFGVPEGKYYVIIESNYPASMAKNKKVYIAKKIQVGKYKKIMGVFSKKL